MNVAGAFVLLHALTSCFLACSQHREATQRRKHQRLQQRRRQEQLQVCLSCVNRLCGAKLVVRAAVMLLLWLFNNRPILLLSKPHEKRWKYHTAGMQLLKLNSFCLGDRCRYLTARCAVPHRSIEINRQTQDRTRQVRHIDRELRKQGVSSPPDVSLVQSMIAKDSATLKPTPQAQSQRLPAQNRHKSKRSGNLGPLASSGASTTRSASSDLVIDQKAEKPSVPKQPKLAQVCQSRLGVCSQCGTF